MVVGFDEEAVAELEAELARLKQEHRDLDTAIDAWSASRPATSCRSSA